MLDRRGLLDLVEKRMAEEMPVEELRAEETLLKRIGFIDRDVDYENVLREMFREQVAGLYDTEDRTVYVLADLSLPEAMLTLWHEVVHALQDQNFRVGDVQDGLEDDGDRQIAYRALCEGDATITSVLLGGGLGPFGFDLLVPDDADMLRSMLAVSEETESIPKTLLDVLMFPYVEGVLFVRRKMQADSLTSINDLFRRPPRSSEQVIHWEKYNREDPPAEIRFGDPPPALDGWTVAYDDTFGELGIRIWIEHLTSRNQAEMAAAGWGGDRVALLVPGDGDGGKPPSPKEHETAVKETPAAPSIDDVWVLWRTVWDPADVGHEMGSAGEAIEFERAAIRAMDACLCGEPKETAEPPRASPDPWTVDAGPGGVGGVRREGLAVFLAFGPPGRHRDVVPILRSLAD